VGPLLMPNTFDTTGDSMERRFAALLLVACLMALGAISACTFAGPDQSVVTDPSPVIDEQQAIEEAVIQYLDLLIEGEVVSAQERDAAFGRYSSMDVTPGFVEKVTVGETRSERAGWTAKAILFVADDGGINHSFAVNLSGTSESSGRQIAVESAVADLGSQ